MDSQFLEHCHFAEARPPTRDGPQPPPGPPPGPPPDEVIVLDEEETEMMRWQQKELQRQERDEVMFLGSQKRLGK